MVDDGPGWPSDGRERLFDRFARPDISRTRTGVGSGLGLAIVSALVSDLGGTVRAQDTPGGGATVLVRFPAAAVGSSPLRT